MTLPNKLSKLSLYAAIASLGTLVATSPAEAVNVSADGRGQVLLYPYYTARVDAAGNTYTTLLSVANPTANAKAVRVRFMEGRNSREVLGFNVFLSPFDIWTAGVLPDTTTGGAKVGTFDGSCTLPAFSASPTAPFYSFANFLYSGANDDGAGTTLDRTKEGHFEIIEMATYASSSITGTAITHVNGVPPCGGNLSDAQAAADAQPPSGGLFGSLTLLNINSGTDYTADAVALANFYQTGSNYQVAGASLPDLTQASPPMSAIQAPNGTMYESLWGTGTADAVSATLMHDSVINEFVLDTVTNSGTDWIVTMPTKRFYVSKGTGNASRLFQRNFDAASGSCDDIALNIWDREERTIPPPEIIIPRTTFALCWQANVITFNNTNVLGSKNAANLQQASFQNGMLKVGFPTGIAGASATTHQLINSGATSISGGGRATTTGNTTTYVGLPVIGFAVMSFQNGTLQIGTPPANVLSNYGGNFVHKTNTTIQAAAAPPTGCVATVNGGSSATLTSSGGSVNLAVTGCTPSTGLSYSWARNGTFGVNTAASWTDAVAPNGTSIGRTVSYQVQVCSGGACLTVPSTPLTVIVPASPPPTGCSATINGGTAPVTLTSSGGIVSLAVTGCTPSGGLTYNWFRNGISGANNSAGWTDSFNPNDTGTSQTVTYQVQVCNGGACLFYPSSPLTVAILSASSPITGCVATVNGGTAVTLPGGGGNVRLDVSGCVPGNGLSYNWSRNGIPGASSTATWTDSVAPNNGAASQRINYQVDVCISGACVTVPAQKPLSVYVPPPPPSGCAGFTKTHVIDFDWANAGRIVVLDVGPTDAIVARFTTGNVDSSDNNLPNISGAEWSSPPSGRYAVLSESACDFGPQVWPGAIAASNSPRVNFAIGAGNNFNFYPILKKNTTYYFNVKNLDQQTCSASRVCDMFIELAHPGGI